ncbi:MAG: hypothetical protein IPM35_20210 [Myxococcales bacterium]|nr:hypothetical protein [Myxococcales bacterium]
MLAVTRHPALTWQLVDLDQGVLHRPGDMPAFARALDDYFASGAPAPWCSATTASA